LPSITHTARFHPGDEIVQILDDLACPSCGHRDPGGAFPTITGGRVRMFCDSCGTFVTILLTDEQAIALDRPDIVLRYRARPG
jgi:hypothetical protein